MELRHALEVLQLDPCEPPSHDVIRKQYLKLALKLHPDRNPAHDAAERFRALGDAYEAALQAVAHDEAVHVEARRTHTLLDLFRRALRGEDVRRQLDELGVYSPPAQFGVDLGVRFDSRLPQGGEEEGEPTDVAAAFKQAFEDEGLDEAGGPVEGFAFAPGEEI